VDLPAAIPSSPSWRSAALVAAAIAAVELVALVVLLVVVVAKPFAHRVEQARQATVAAAKAAPAAPKPKLSRSQTSILVLNGNGISDSAGRMASAVHRFRYVVAGTANAPRTNFRHSVVMFRRGYKAEGLRLGHDLGISSVTPLDGLRAGNLAGAQLVLIVGRGQRG